jgi:hypothetical protein
MLNVIHLVLSQANCKKKKPQTQPVVFVQGANNHRPRMKSQGAAINPKAPGKSKNTLEV